MEQAKCAVTYVDTLAVLLKRRPRRQDVQALATMARRRLRLTTPRPMDYRCRVLLHQPTDSEMQLVRDMAALCSGLVSELHPALDLVTDTKKDAQRLGEWLNRRVVKLWHGKQKTGWCVDTRYSSQRCWRTKQLVTYADLPSKVTGQPCLHVEYRIRGAKLARSTGIKNCRDVVRMNWLDWWRQQLLLEEVDLRKLGRQATSRTRQKKTTEEERYDTEIRAGCAVARWAMHAANEPYITAQAVRDECKKLPWFDARFVMKRLDVELPAPD